ncbi:hypothetical protein [Frigoriflavimonas asaccharolytica]|uniref:Nuclear transport factor 2 family protein n=1 Tax=Frigoriflavimonas asaccharolytica TaxID=2735899 RepID=A0A8J8K9Q2_9FLAO|nr:hypothetical protein [Frigoriflavimonas asaccharolytica]NRS93302.1 hypothetical protein [Frigoriflavimonas asaccharolytica]
MKTILNTLLLIILNFTGTFNAQKTPLDTLNYLKQFEINKAQYINKPLSILLNNMTAIKPKTHWGDSNPNNKNAVVSTMFNFCEKYYTFNNAITMRITWDISFPRSEVEFPQNNNNFYYTNEEKLFYQDKIVKDISVYRR